MKIPAPRQRLAFTKRISSCTWSPDGLNLAVSLAGGELCIIDMETQVRKNYPVKGWRGVWSPDSTLFASMDKGKVHIWDARHEVEKESLSFPEDISDLAWAPDATMLAVGFATGGVEVLDLDTMAQVSWCDAHSGSVYLEWGEDDQIVSLSKDAMAIWRRVDRDAGRFIELQEDSLGSNGEVNHVVEEPFDVEGDQSMVPEARIDQLIRSPHDDFTVSDLAHLRNGRIVTSGLDGTLKIWSSSGALLNIYENPTGDTFATVSATAAGEYVVASNAGDGTIHIIDVRTFSMLGTYSHEQSASDAWGREELVGLQPNTFDVTFIDHGDDEVRICSLSDSLPFSRPGSISHYRNAKIVLVGDSGVGKSGLSLALSGKVFQPTESTHARNVWALDAEDLVGKVEHGEKRELLLWDLAGQPGYRLFHKLSLRDVSIGLIVFDARSESEPFRGVSYWSKALDEAAMPGAPLVKILISARSDRGGVSVSSNRVSEVLEGNKIAKFHETSAKTGMGIADLIESISQCIRWDSLPIVAAPQAFTEIRKYLISEKRRGAMLVTQEELEQGFTDSNPGSPVSREILELCLGRLEATGLVARISFGDRWLLQPELLDSYVAWLAHAARSEPDGLGAIDEGRALRGEYEHEALTRASDEQAMLVTAVEEVVGRGLALRVPTEQGQMIVFPSELRTDLPDYPDGYTIEVIFKFEGHVSAIYSTVTVLLINSLGFGSNYRLFKNAAIFGFDTESFCGLAAHYEPNRDDVAGRILVFFGPGVSAEQKLSFLRYVDFQLRKLALAGTVLRERIYTCYSCDYQLPPEVVERRSNLGHETLICPVCGVTMNMDNLVRDSAVKDGKTSRLVRQAVHEQARQQRLTSYSLRREIEQYHVFICYNSVDRGIVQALNQNLRRQGVITWIDDDEMVGGDRHTQEIESIIDSVPCAIVAVGPNSLGPWQEQEYHALLQQAVTRRKKGTFLRVIPVLLPGAGSIEIPPFLGVHSIIDMRGHDIGGENLRNLVDAILTPMRVQA
ncbi:TIR domain-containing protein [Streptomyces sp. NPDC001536]|uniref:TIR domain-containing protein n=1 Tax=Streptomyces sp. NPDC001536 TaxID=3364583 RepID=UPI0036B39B8A